MTENSYDIQYYSKNITAVHLLTVERKTRIQRDTLYLM